MRSCRKVGQFYLLQNCQRTIAVYNISPKTQLGVCRQLTSSSHVGGLELAICGNPRTSHNPTRSVPCLDLCYGPEYDRHKRVQGIKIDVILPISGLGARQILKDLGTCLGKGGFKSLDVQGVDEQPSGIDLRGSAPV